jgi:hypothetical protein
MTKSEKHFASREMNYPDYMTNQIKLEVLPENQLQLFHSLSKKDWMSDFYLAGGTVF